MERSYAELEDLGPEQAQQARDLYEASFPASEREPYEDLRVPGGHAVAELDGTEVTGIAATIPLQCGWHLLAYLAAHPARRGEGTGSRLYKLIQDRTGTPLVLEIEDPAAATHPDEEAERRRRLRFYQRHGAVQLHAERYLAPNLAGGAPLPMLLLATKEQSPAETEELVRAVLATYQE